MNVREAQAVNALLRGIDPTNLTGEPDPDEVIAAASVLAGEAHRVLGSGLDGPAAALLVEQLLAGRGDARCLGVATDKPETPNIRPGTTLTVPDSPKMVRETFRAAKAVLRWATDIGPRQGEHVARLQRLIDESDRQIARVETS